MSRALEETLSKIKEDRVLSEQAKQWQGKAHYFSPRAPESWDVPPHLSRFENQSAVEVNKIVSDYGKNLAKEKDVKSVREVVGARKSQTKAKTPMTSWSDEHGSRLSRFEQAFRVNPRTEEEPRKGGLLGWLSRRRQY